MPRLPESMPGRRSWTQWAALAALLGVAAWLLFFDSYSVVKRVSWHREQAQLIEQNQALRAEINTLEQQLDAGISDEMVERIAREQYGMQRPDETVYRVDQEK